MAKAKAVRFVDQTTTIGAAVSDAFSQLESLGIEMRDWYDNMPENLQGGSKGDAVNEAADALEGISEADIPENLREVEVKYQDDLKARSRSARRDVAVGMLMAVVQELEEKRDEEIQTESDDAADERRDNIQQVIDDVQQMIDDAEGVEFPGMFG